MICATAASRPVGAAFWQRLRQIMDVILHVGAHHCAADCFQTYLRRNLGALLQSGTGVWGPWHARMAQLDALQPGPSNSSGRQARARALNLVRQGRDRTRNFGVRRLVISDADMLGSVRVNLRLADLYSGVGERMARLSEAFDADLSAVAMNIRSLDTYWSAVFRLRAADKAGPVHPRLVDRVAGDTRSWRDVITELAAALPGVPLGVMPYEVFSTRPDAQLSAIAGGSVPEAEPRMAADLPGEADPWTPFSASQRAELRERYADDLMWLVAGADGLAKLADDPAPYKAGIHPPFSDMTRGRHDERRHIHVARDGRGRTARQTG